MKRFMLIPAVVSIVLLLSAGVTQASPPVIVGTVGPGFTITLKRNGAAVTKLRAGKYTLRIVDRSSSHNFRLRGNGVNSASGVAEVRTRNVTVTLKRGFTYRFLCDPHPRSMRGLVRAV